MRQLAPILLLLFVVLASGCTPTPTSLTEKSGLPPVPSQWGTSPQHSPAPPTAWLDSMADPQLHELVTEALHQNYNLQRLAARITAAEARAQQAGAKRLPDAELAFTAGRRQTNNNGSASISNNFSLQTALSWEVDLWNRLGLSAQAAISEVSASRTDRYAAELSLAANIARSWFRLAESGLQLQLGRDTEASYIQSLQVIEEQYRSGLSGALDLRLARAALANAQSNRANRQQELDFQQRQLETLLGRYPAGKLTPAQDLPQITTSIPVGLPSGLLERRPDLKSAAQRLIAAEQLSGAAGRNLLPGFRLTAAGGTSSTQLRNLLDWDYLIWSLAGSLTQSLFDGGSRTAEQDLARSKVEEQLADYATTALNAFREVETALAAETHLQEQENALQTATREAQEAQVLAEQRYTQGLEGIITLLETQRRATATRVGLLNIRRLRLENRINLHLALGGPFASPSEPLTAKDTP